MTLVTPCPSSASPKTLVSRDAWTSTDSAACERRAKHGRHLRPRQCHTSDHVKARSRWPYLGTGPCGDGVLQCDDAGMPCTVVTLDTVMDDTSVSATTAPVTELPSTDWMTEIWLCAHVKEQTAE